MSLAHRGLFRIKLQTDYRYTMLHCDDLRFSDKSPLINNSIEKKNFFDSNKRVDILVEIVINF